MFKVTTSPTLWVRVDTGAIDAEGKRVTGYFEIQCKRLSIPELTALNESAKANEFPDAAFLREVIVNWRGVANEDGTSMEFNDDNLTKVLNAGFSADMARAFYSAMPGAKQKN